MVPQWGPANQKKRRCKISDKVKNEKHSERYGFEYGGLNAYKCTNELLQNSSFNRDLWGNRIITQLIPIINTSVCKVSFIPVCFELSGIVITPFGS